jgi:hypothetical protein
MNKTPRKRLPQMLPHRLPPRMMPALLVLALVGVPAGFCQADMRELEPNALDRVTAAGMLETDLTQTRSAGQAAGAISSGGSVAREQRRGAIPLNRLARQLRRTGLPGRITFEKTARDSTPSGSVSVSLSSTSGDRRVFSAAKASTTGGSAEVFAGVDAVSGVAVAVATARAGTDASQ